MLGSLPRLAEDRFMARSSKVPRHGAALHSKMPKDIARRVDKGRKNPTLIQNQHIVVRFASFTFRFVCAAQMREYLGYFQQKTHPTSRIRGAILAGDLGEDWRGLRSWDVERWFERLPMYLFEEPKRKKVVKALSRALQQAETEEI